MKFKTIKSAFVALAVLSMLLPTSAGFTVSGAIFGGVASPGKELVHEIDVSIKEDASPVNVTTLVFGLAMNPRGSKIKLVPEEDTGPYSAREFLTVTPKSFQLQPGVPQKVLVKAEFPEDVGTGGRYALVTITTEPEGTNGNIRTASSIQVPVLLLIAGTEIVETGEITDLEVSKGDEGAVVDLMFENTGNYHYKPTASSVLKNQDGEILATSLPMQSYNSVLPTGSWLFRMDLVPESELAPGTYTIEATVIKEDETVLDSEETTLEINS